MLDGSITPDDLDVAEVGDLVAQSVTSLHEVAACGEVIWGGEEQLLSDQRQFP